MKGSRWTTFQTCRWERKRSGEAVRKERGEDSERKLHGERILYIHGQLRGVSRQTEILMSEFVTLARSVARIPLRFGRLCLPLDIVTTSSPPLEARAQADTILRKAGKISEPG